MQSASDLTGAHMLPARLPKGFAVGDYTVHGWVRDGGMAAIYRAERSADRTRVALKLQLPSTVHLPEICARFDREAEAMRRVSGAPNVVELYDADTLEDGRRYFVMEWIEGEDLDELLDFRRDQDQRLSIAQVCRIGRDIAAGLATMHEQQLVHRDLKPANVMLGLVDDDIESIKLVDFGIVADLRAEGGGAEVGAGEEAIMGTSAYMAPEQVAGVSPDPKIDLFALGVVLYEALTGNCVPPDGWTPETLPEVESLRRGVPEDLAELVRACMSSAPERRPASAGEVVEAFGEILQALELGDAGPISEEIPIRAPGGTIVTPQAEVEVLESAVVRTGETEVSLTHEQVLTISGSISRSELAGATGAGAATTMATAATTEVSRSGLATPSPSAANAVSVATAATAANTGAKGKTRALTEQYSAIVGTPPGVPASDVAGRSSSGASPSGRGSVASVTSSGLQKATSGGSGPEVRALVPSIDSSGAVERASARVPVAVERASTRVPVVAEPDIGVSGVVPLPMRPHEPALRVVTPSMDDQDIEDDGVSVPRRRWLVLLALIPLAVGAAWWFIGHGERIDAPERVAVASELEPEPEPALVDASALGEPGDAKGAFASDLGDLPEPDSDEVDETTTIPGEAPQFAAEPEPRASSRASATSSNKGRSNHLDKAKCEAKRAEAKAAKIDRKWNGVLKMTAQRSCWSGPFRIERRRLRVEAHAELGHFAKCIKEAGNSSDRDIAPRVRWCRGRLG